MTDNFHDLSNVYLQYVFKYKILGKYLQPRLRIIQQNKNRKFKNLENAGGEHP